VLRSGPPRRSSCRGGPRGGGVDPITGKRGPVLKLGWARSNNTLGTLECAQYGGTTLICWRDCKHEQFARPDGNFSLAGGARRADGQRAKKTPTAGREAAGRAWAMVVMGAGPAARKCGGRNCHGGEYLACAHAHSAVSLQGSIRQTNDSALLDSAQGNASSPGRIRTAWTHRYAHAAGASAYCSRSSVEIDFQGPAIRTAALGEA
jgi:hypothetical protein